VVSLNTLLSPFEDAAVIGYVPKRPFVFRANVDKLVFADRHDSLCICGVGDYLLTGATTIRPSMYNKSVFRSFLLRLLRLNCICSRNQNIPESCVFRDGGDANVVCRGCMI
jgi:hypothetical protein